MPELVRKTATEDPSFLAHALRIATAMDDRRAKDIVAYDIRELTLIADCFIICTAMSEPQMKAVCNSIKDDMKEAGAGPLQIEGEFSGGWVVLDFGTILAHVFREQAREFYDLDGLWGDAPKVDLGITQ